VKELCGVQRVELAEDTQIDEDWRRPPSRSGEIMADDSDDGGGHQFYST